MLPKPNTELSSRIKSLVDRVGTPPVAHFFGVADATIARVAAGITVSRGTLAIIERKLEEANNALAK